MRKLFFTSSKDNMRDEIIIYSLRVEDIFKVIEDNEMKIILTKQDVKFIEDKIGEIIDWRGAIESALWEVNNKKQRHTNAE